MCRPVVSTMVDHFSAAFSTPSQPIMDECDTRTEEALTRLVSTLPTNPARLLVAQLDEAWAERELLWRNVLSGTTTPRRTSPPPPCGTTAASPPTMVTVTMSPLARKRMKIQSLITACVDTGIQNSLLQMHENKDSWGADTWSPNSAMRRSITPACGDSTPHHGPVLGP